MHPKASSTLGSTVEVSSSRAEIELKEEKVCDVAAWVLDIGATDHMFGCRAAFNKLNTVVLCIVCFGDDSMAQIEGRRTIVSVCTNGESRSLERVYFILRPATNIMSIRQLNEDGYKIDIDTGVMKIREVRSLLLARVKRDANRLYLLHIKHT
jgi:hypothetical protein